MTVTIVNQPDGRKAYRQGEIVKMIGISLPTWHRMRRAGIAPPPDISFARTRLWKKETIDKFLESQTPKTSAS